jgi:hypothetical protein
VFDKADQPENVDFYQIKSQSEGSWSLKDMTRKQGNGSPPVTFLGRLHQHMGAFGQMVAKLGFLSNMGFKLKLADGITSTQDHHVVKSTDLHTDEMELLKASVTKDAVSPPAIDGSHPFAFERTPLGIIGQDTFVKGRLVEFVEERGGAEHVPLMSLYQTLLGSVFTKTGVTQADFRRAEPVLKGMGKRILHAGPAEMGQVFKMCNQLMAASHIQAMCEAFALGRAHGADLEVLRNALAGGAAGSWMLDNLGPQVIAKDARAGFRIDLQLKDLKLALDATFEKGVPLPGLALASALYLEARAHGEGANGNQALFRTFDRMSNQTGVVPSVE